MGIMQGYMIPILPIFRKRYPKIALWCPSGASPSP